ncbi:MAG TPA: PD-(D/E)XK nuclease family protein [Chitinivibrionales bacterium]
MSLSYQSYDFTPILGWSISRYECFDKCKRHYYYTYYAKHARDVAPYKIKQLKDLTSAPLEIGNVVHDVIEAFLRRLQISDADIDEQRFFQFARQKAQEAFGAKTFLENYYGALKPANLEDAFAKINACLQNFIGSPCYSWIFMKAMTNKTDWLIEPPGYGETRLNGMKAYCKMDFLFPVDGAVHILDWKTGAKDSHKHANQLIGYAAAAQSNFNIPGNAIFPKIVYLFPAFEEFELARQEDFTPFFDKVKQQTEAMYALCADVEKNIPLDIDAFPKSPSQGLCLFCNFQEPCFSKKGFPQGNSGESF